MSKSAMLLFVVVSAQICLAQPGKVSDIALPDGYTRITCTPGGYSVWIRSLPLKTTNIAMVFNGDTISADYFNIFAVVALPLLFKQDLEQCADFSFRFWAEFHKQTNRLGNLYLFDYNGNRRSFSSSGKTFNAFLKQCMGFSNSYSIKKGCLTVDTSALRPGDMFVQNETGGIGHVSVIVDACTKQNAPKLYLVGFSFMPAQEFHIEKATDDYGSQGWFSLQGYFNYLRDHLDYGAPVLKRFGD